VTTAIYNSAHNNTTSLQDRRHTNPSLVPGLIEDILHKFTK